MQICVFLQVEVLKRQGVSQYKQPHIMLKRGLELVEELFPDYRSKMCKAGALQTDLLKDSVIVSPFNACMATLQSTLALHNNGVPTAQV